MRGSFAALAVREFAVLSIGSFTVFFMRTVIRDIVAFQLTGKNSAGGVLLLDLDLAFALCGPFGGAVADGALETRARSL